MSRRAGGSEDKWFVTRVYPAYPNRTQERELLRQLNVARGVYNHFADTCIHCLIDGVHIPDPMEMNREFTLMRADDCLLRSVNSYTLREVINRVWQAVERCERRSLADGELHVPRIKTPPRFRSICFDPKSSKIENSRIRLNRDLSVRCRNLARPRNGRAVTVRAVRRGTGRWYICITYETDRVVRGEMDVGEPDRAEGYDLGLVDLITDSRGNKIRTPDFFMEAGRTRAPEAPALQARGGHRQMAEDAAQDRPDRGAHPSQARRMPGQGGGLDGVRQNHGRRRGHRRQAAGLKGGRHARQKETFHGGRMGDPRREGGAQG